MGISRLWAQVQRGKLDPVNIFQDGVPAQKGSELLPVLSIFKIEYISISNTISIYSKGFMEVFGDDLIKKAFNGNTIVRGFDE